MPTDTATHTCDYCLDADCAAITSQGWLACANRAFFPALRVLEAAWDANARLETMNRMPATEVFNDPTDIAFHTFNRS